MSGVIAFALKQRVIMLVLFVATLASGLFAFWQLNIEAYPDPTPPMVDVITQSAGLSAEEALGINVPPSMQARADEMIE